MQVLPASCGAARLHGERPAGGHRQGAGGFDWKGSFFGLKRAARPGPAGGRPKANWILCNVKEVT